MDWTIWSVIELGCWIAHFPDRWPTGRDAEDCLDAHLACNLRHLVWELGRGYLAYHSDLPGATCLGLRPEPAGLTAQQRAVEAMFRSRCQLRAALRHGHDRDCVVYGRLCMNRHYGPGSPHRSEFATRHPEFLEQRKDGWVDPSRLSFAAEEYRRERVAILVEAARIGCDGLCLDFCRQPPMVRYHPAAVSAWRESAKVDARLLRRRADREAFLAWARFRAGYVTAFLRELKAALDPFRQRYGKPVPVQARIPNDGFEANLIAGLEVEAWCAEGLVDQLALSELRWLEGYDAFDDGPYLELGRRHGLPVYASSNCLPTQYGGWGGECNPAGVNPWVLARRALDSLEAGAQGVCLYQTDLGVQWPGLDQVLTHFADPDALRAYVDDATIRERYPVTDAQREYGIDNHSKPPDARERLDGI